MSKKDLYSVELTHDEAVAFVMLMMSSTGGGLIHAAVRGLGNALLNANPRLDADQNRLYEELGWPSWNF